MIDIGPAAMSPAGATVMFVPAGFGLAVELFPSVGPTEAAGVAALLAVAVADAVAAATEDCPVAVDGAAAAVAVPVEAAAAPEFDEAAGGADGDEAWLAEQPTTARAAITA